MLSDVNDVFEVLYVWIFSSLIQFLQIFEIYWDLK